MMIPPPDGHDDDDVGWMPRDLLEAVVDDHRLLLLVAKDYQTVRP
jgi:hypothetical protein